MRPRSPRPKGAAEAGGVARGKEGRRSRGLAGGEVPAGPELVAGWWPEPKVLRRLFRGGDGALPQGLRPLQALPWTRQGHVHVQGRYCILQPRVQTAADETG
ncbi:hypothetical protein B296_00011092 [Ensete ventricosum]|uniref:Uncharacterized protein n=1 Tax=Ensete ventricosum TaxID=4639 RepID=A0A427B1J5_ENSVE|nr:hypothetical protein B296_00011092 [Ensete ventricosum]